MTEKKQTGTSEASNVPATQLPPITPSLRKEKLDEVAVKVLEHLQGLVETGNIIFPPNYSKENAVKGAMIYLAEATDKEGLYLIDKCTLPSIANSIMAMCIDGLSVWKKQGYFISYHNKTSGKYEMKWQPDYRGHILLAKRDADVKEVNANCVYNGDIFKYQVDTKSGRMNIVEHVPDLKNQDIAKINGAYAVVVFNDNSTQCEIMTIAQIRQSWLMGAADGVSKAHKQFTDRMCRRTVINRATNNIIGSSDDSEVIDEDLQATARDEKAKDSGKKKIGTNIDFEEVGRTIPSATHPDSAAVITPGEDARTNSTDVNDDMATLGETEKPY